MKTPEEYKTEASQMLAESTQIAKEQYDYFTHLIQDLGYSETDFQDPDNLMKFLSEAFTVLGLTEQEQQEILVSFANMCFWVGEDELEASLESIRKDHEK